MQRDTPGEKLVFTSADSFPRTNPTINDPLLAASLDSPRLPAHSFIRASQNQKSGSSTTTQSTKDSSPAHRRRVAEITAVVPKSLDVISNGTWDPKVARRNQPFSSGGTLEHKKRVAPYSSSSLNLNYQSTGPRQLAQLQEYSRRIAKLQHDRNRRTSASTSSSTQGTRNRANNNQTNASNAVTADTSLLTDRSDKEGVTHSQYQQTNNLFDVFHPRQESAPVVLSRHDVSLYS